MKKLLLCSAALTIYGCASSGPIPIGNDTYIIDKQSAGGLFVTGQAVKADLLKEAVAYCASKGKEIHLLDSQENNAVPFVHTSSAEVKFTCTQKSDSAK